MKSIYESIRSIMTEAEPAPGSPAAKSKERGQAIKDFFSGASNPRTAAYQAKKAAEKPQAAQKTPTQTDLGNASASKDGSFGNPKTSNPVIAASRDKIASQMKSGERQSATAMPAGRKGPGSYEEMPKKADVPQANALKPNTPNSPTKGSSDFEKSFAAARKEKGPGDQFDFKGKKYTTDYKDETKPAATKPAADTKQGSAPTDTSSYSGGDRFQGQKKTDTETGGDALKAASNVTVKDQPAMSYAANHLSGNKAPEAPKDNNIDVEATKARDSLKGFKPNYNMVQDNPKTDKFVTKTYTPEPEKDLPQAAAKPEKDTTVRSSSGEPVKTGSGGTLKTQTDDEIANRGVYGTEKYNTKKKVTAEQFGVTSATVRAVMEVLMKSNVKGSMPRNDKEKKLAAMHGDPDVITHGDILKARGVTMKTSPGKARGDAEYKNVKEEEYQIDELKKSTIASYIQKKFGKMSDELVSKNQYGYAKKDAKGIRNAGLRMSGVKATQNEGTMRGGKYVNDAPRPGTNEVPLPDEGYRPPKKAMKPGSTTKAMGDVEEEMSSKMKMKLGLYGKKKSSMKEALDPKYKTPNMDAHSKRMEDPSIKKFSQDTDSRSGSSAAMGALSADERGQEKYKDRKSGGIINKIKDTFGVDKPDEKYGPKKESMDTPGNSYKHQCAIHVKSESFGEGRTVTTQHADPDADGNIAWYDVMFEHGIEKYVPTDELEILVSESHMHAKRKKPMGEGSFDDRMAERSARLKKAEEQGAAAGREKAMGGGGDLPVDRNATSTTTVRTAPAPAAAPAERPQAAAAPTPAAAPAADVGAEDKARQRRPAPQPRGSFSASGQGGGDF